MTLLRSQVEEILCNRLGGWLRAAGLDYSTTSGTNGDLNDPIGFAVRQSGGTVADPVAVVDADVATVADDFIDKLFDVAELRTLVTISQHFQAVDLTIGPKSENFDQLGMRIAKEIERKRKEVESTYGFGGSEFESGIITSVFASHNEDLT